MKIRKKQKKNTYEKKTNPDECSEAESLIVSLDFMAFLPFVDFVGEGEAFLCFLALEWTGQSSTSMGSFGLETENSQLNE